MLSGPENHVGQMSVDEIGEL